MVSLAAFQDIRTRRISNKLIYVGICLGFLMNYVHLGIFGLKRSFIGIAIPIVVLMGLFVIRGLGAGDIKLFSVAGAFLGFQFSIRLIIVSLFVGAAFGLIKIVLNKSISSCFNNMSNYLSYIYTFKEVKPYTRNENNTIHFSIPILIGIVLHMGGVI